MVDRETLGDLPGQPQPPPTLLRHRRPSRLRRVSGRQPAAAVADLADQLTITPHPHPRSPTAMLQRVDHRLVHREREAVLRLISKTCRCGQPLDPPPHGGELIDPDRLIQDQTAGRLATSAGQPWCRYGNIHTCVVPAQRQLTPRPTGNTASAVRREPTGTGTPSGVSVAGEVHGLHGPQRLGLRAQPRHRPRRHNDR